MWGGGKGGRARLLREARRYRRREELRGRQCVSSVLGWCVWVNLEGESARAHCLLPPPSLVCPFRREALPPQAK